MTSEEIVALSKNHTIFEWTAQKSLAPIAVARAEGVYFWTPEGKRFIDFNSQLMSVNSVEATASSVSGTAARPASVPAAPASMKSRRVITPYWLFGA